MNPWDIYLAKVPFEDCSTSKIRPVVILWDTAMLIDCIKMTSRRPRSGEYSLRFWKEAGLHKPTTVRISKRFLLASDSFIKKIGVLHPVDIIEIEKLLSYVAFPA